MLMNFKVAGYVGLFELELQRSLSPVCKFSILRALIHSVRMIIKTEVYVSIPCKVLGTHEWTTKLL
jgi:hypothetical protein